MKSLTHISNVQRITFTSILGLGMEQLGRHLILLIQALKEFADVDIFKVKLNWREITQSAVTLMVQELFQNKKRRDETFWKL